jgi:hypothetical protein
MAKTATDTTTAPATNDSNNSSLPSCRLCGHTDYFLGDHLVEAHGLSLDAYLKAYPGSPTVSQEALDMLEKGKKKGVRREGPPADSALSISLRGFVVPINPDVAESACLPLPPHYRLPEHGDLAIDIVEALISIIRGRHTYIFGLPGSGKDALLHAFSYLTRRPTLIRQVDPNVDIESWLYTREFDEKGTTWKEQELLVALRDGYLTSTGRRIPYTILITDFDRANKAQAEFLRMILDSISGRVRGPAGKIYTVFPGTQIVVTANTAGGGDSRGRMVSANVIDGSILDRFERVFQFHWMEWADEGPIVNAKFPMLAQRCPGIFKQVGKATASLRDAIHKETLYAEFSHRGVCKWLGHAEDIVAMTGKVPKDLPRRAARAFLDGMPDDETRLQAQRLIDPHIKGGVVGVRESDASSDPLGGF